MSNTITVQRANVILDISPEQKDYYLGQGFSVIDDWGHVIEKTAVESNAELSAIILQLKKQLKEKDEEIARLKAQKPSKSKKNT